MIIMFNEVMKVEGSQIIDYLLLNGSNKQRGMLWKKIKNRAKPYNVWDQSLKNAFFNGT